MPAASACSQNLVVRRRRDLVTSVQWQRGQRVFVVKDPLALKYYRFNEHEQAILQMLDRPQTPDAIVARLAREFPAAPVTADDVKAFIASLYRHALVVSAGPSQGRKLIERRDAQRRVGRRRLTTNILSIRTPGVDPTRLLNVLYPWTSWLFGPRAIVGVALLAIVAICIFAINASRLPSELMTMHAFFGPGNWLLLAITFAVTKMLHELGHALSCRRCGGECHGIGVMFLVLTPCLYCDVSDSWMLPSKWQRAAIAAAGMYVEVMLASVATIVWAHSTIGTLHFLALQVMLVCGVSTVMFNGNPLARYDGYHILADFVEIPNLRDVARAALSARLWSLVGIERRGAVENASWKLALFGLAVTLYRWVLLASILWGLHYVLAARGLEVAWQCIFASVAISVVVLPIVRLLRAFRRREVVRSMKPTRLIVVTTVVAACAIAFFCVPLPHYVHGTFETRYADSVQVYATQAGTLEHVWMATGSRVSKGEVLGQMRNLDLELELARLSAEVNDRQREVKSLEYSRFSDPLAIESLAQAQKSLAASQEKLAERTAEAAGLQVIAPQDGVVLLPTRRAATHGATLASWTGTPLDERNQRAPLARGDVVCEIGDPTRLEALVVADQNDMKSLQAGQSVELVLDAQPLAVCRGTIAEISLNKLATTPEGLSVHAGGQLASRPDSSGAIRPLNPSYSVIVPLAAEATPAAAGLRGSARVFTGRETLAMRSWRYLCRTFRFEW